MLKLTTSKIEATSYPDSGNASGADGFVITGNVPEREDLDAYKIL